MNPRRLFLMAVLCVLTVTAAFAQFSPRKDYVWARDIAGATMTLNGNLNESVWAKAESLVITYGENSPVPSSGWKIANGTGAVTNGANAIVKFLADKASNTLYIGLTAKDSSVGGAGWENSDGILAGMYDRLHRATSGITLHRDIFITWIDSTGVGTLPNLKGGNLPSGNIITAAATVQGTSNSDTNSSGARVADQGWTLEMAVALDSLGYHANADSIDAVQMTIDVWDMDWAGTPSQIATKAWWANEWGNNGGGLAGRILLRNDVDINTMTLPTYGPDWIIPNAENYQVTVDGDLSDSVWAHVPSFDIQFGDSLLKASYPTIGPDRSGQWVTKLSSALQSPIDPGRARVKTFFKGDTLFFGVDVEDQALSRPMGGDDFIDAVQLSLNVPIDTLRDAVHQIAAHRLGFAIDSVAKGGFSLLWDAQDWMTKGALTWGLHLKPGSTIDNPSDVDAGYTVEAALDLSKLGYTAGASNKMVAFGVGYHDFDATATDTSSYRTWWFREWPWSATPAFGELSNTTVVTDVDMPGDPLVADRFQLFGNYPNPFNPTTKIMASFPEAGTARLSVYNVLGQLVRQSEFQVRTGGVHNQLFDASQLASGFYFYRVEFTAQRSGAKQVSDTMKMLFLK